MKKGIHQRVWWLSWPQSTLILWHAEKAVPWFPGAHSLYCCQGNSKAQLTGKGFNIGERSLDLESGELD